MRMFVWSVVFAAAVVAACTSTRDATAPRRFAPRLTVQVDHDSAHLSSTQLQVVKGWGLDAGIGPYPFYNAVTDRAESLLYNMGITFIRDQIDPALYDSGSTIGDMFLNADTMNAYIAKWDTAKAHNLKYILSVWSRPRHGRLAAP